MLKKFFEGSEFAKNTAVLISGTILAQAVPVLLQPFLRRIYSPEEFGAMAIFLSIFSMITIVSSFRYESTIVLPKNDIQAINILALAFWINFFFNGLIFLIILFFRESISEFIGLSVKYINYFLLLPLTSFLFSFYQNLNYWLIRKKAFKESSLNKLVRRSAEGIVQLSLGVLRIPGGLFYGDLIGNFSNVLAGIKQAKKNHFFVEFISKRKMRFMFRKYIDYPKYNMVPTLLSSAASLLPFLFINKYYSTEVVGYLDLTRLVLSIPLVFISATIGQVLFQRITEKKHHQLSVKNDLLGISYILFGIICLELIILFLWGEVLFKLIYGESYIRSAIFAKILIFSFSLNFITSTFSSIFITFNKIRVNSIWQVFYFISVCSLLFFTEYDIIGFIRVYVLIEIVMSLINCILLFKIVSNYERDLSKVDTRK